MADHKEVADTLNNYFINVAVDIGNKIKLYLAYKRLSRC